jgi:hypothetical protein
MTGNKFFAARHVCLPGYCVKTSDVDLLGNLNRIINFDAEVTHGALDLGMTEQRLQWTEQRREGL